MFPNKVYLELTHITCGHGFSAVKSWEVTEMALPTKPKIFAIWPLSGQKFVDPYILSLVLGPDHAARSPGGHCKMQVPGAPPAPEFLIQEVWSGAWEFACLNRLSGDANAASRGGIIIDLTGPLLMDSCVVWVLGPTDWAGLSDPAQGSYCMSSCSGLPG